MASTTTSASSGDGAVDADADAGSRRRLSRDVPYLSLIAVNTVPALCATLMSVGIPIFVTSALHGPDWIVGVLFGLNTAILAVAQTTVVRMVGRLRRTRILLLPVSRTSPGRCSWSSRSICPARG